MQAKTLPSIPFLIKEGQVFHARIARLVLLD